MTSLCTLALLLGGVVSACSGGEFMEQAPGAGGAAGSDAGASGGSLMTTAAGILCHGPDECDDGDPCTVDECGGEGLCLYSAKCASGEQCCDGVCSQCCAQEDCADTLDCTTDSCFSGFCTNVPSNGACGANQYCSLVDGCRDREPCPNGTAAECDDGDACTEDTCQNGFCDHAFCSVGEQCCPEQGCAACCSDSQCADDDPCTADVCAGGACTKGPLCSSGKCCPSADETSATCGICCSAEECMDAVDCTVDSCTVDGCTHVPNDAACGGTKICDPEDGCVDVGGCTLDSECVSADPCKVGKCDDNGTCTYDGCSNGTQCCPGIGCRACCDQCCNVNDCLTMTQTQLAPIGCRHVTCEDGTCVVMYEPCDFGYCCDPYGCYFDLCPI